MSRSKHAAAVVLAGVLCVAWGGRSETRQAQDRPVVSGAGPRTDAAGWSVEATLSARDLPVYVARDAEGTRLWDLTKQFYQKRGGALGWIAGRSPRPQMGELIAALQQADREGLDPALYSGSTLSARRVADMDEQEASGLDVSLTYLYLRYASDLTSGVSNLSHADPKWQIRDKKTDTLALLEQAVEQNRVRASLAELIPQHPQYTSLRDALARYRDIAQRGGWSTLPNMKLKPGQQDPVVPALARRLAITGDHTEAVADADTIYGPALQEAVKRFQQRHGLEPDGTVGAAAVAQLNVPVDARIRQLALSLERWRWLPRELGARHILVNIPEYRLEVWENNTVPLQMRVVVGKTNSQTPIFTGDMTHLVFSPYWNVPPDIARTETLPSAIRDASFLQRTNMEVLDRNGNRVDPSSIDPASAASYRFRQRPGSSNSLGLVKFMFPNSYNVYLHDTPADSLFARAKRSFSHGCVRLEQPEQLARYVLGDQPEWTPERISESMHAGAEKHVKLGQPLPVYLGYWTARVSADGLVQFRDDIYGVDARHSTMLAAAVDKLKARATASAAAAESHTETAAPKSRKN